jgi:hypothetical protein
MRALPGKTKEEKMRCLIGFLMLLSLLCGIPLAQTRVETKQTWPHPIPCRTQDSQNKDLFVMTLGDVDTPLADGIFDPSKDEVRVKDGTVIQNYYRDTRGVKYFKPIDKSVFPLPPSGWCSWYYYYQEINETEVKRNAQWIAEHLKDYGARYVQIDDGWQGEGRGRTRDWTTVNNRFPGGMDGLAAYIKSLGLTPGIWLAPHGQSNEAVVKNNPGVFLLKPDGTTASETWEGKFLVDPSIPEAHHYLNDLFTRLSKWGYEYFKIDGQPIVAGEYRTKTAFMKKPTDDPVGLYRNTLDTIRTAIGPSRYLLGCWGIPIEGVGIMNGSRTGGDIVLGWDGGFIVALRATMQHYYLHNVAWYADPDVMLLRSPLPLDQARAWATLQGLTGQALMATDRMMDLSEERVEMLRRVYPAVDIRPLDLFPSRRNKRTWDLKINHLNRRYDVVGVFNFDDASSQLTFLNWHELGLPDTGPMHVFDFWNKEYLGAWETGMTVEVPPTSCRVLTLLPSTNDIQLISTSRHITQGWVDLLALKHDATRNSYTGRSKVIKNDPYQLHFAFPRGKNFAVKSASARSSSKNLPVKISNHQGWATVEIDSPQTTEVSWEVHFEPADLYHYPTREPANLQAERMGLSGVNLKWNAQYYLNAGYQIYLNGSLVGYTPTTAFPIRGLDPSVTYTAEVKTVWEDGTVSERKAELKFTLSSMLPDEIALSELEPVRATAGWRNVQTNRAVSGRPLSIGGKRYDRGIGTHANSDIEYDLKGLYDTFSAHVGVDDGSREERGSVEFLIIGDGKELWRSGGLKKSDGSMPVSVSLSGVHRLVLRVTDAGDGNTQDHADWVDAKITKAPRQSR